MQDNNSCKEGDVGQSKRSIVSTLRGYWLTNERLTADTITAKMIEKDIIIFTLSRVVDLISLKELNKEGTTIFYMNRKAESKCGSIMVRRSLYVLSCDDLISIISTIKKNK